MGQIEILFRHWTIYVIFDTCYTTKRCYCSITNQWFIFQYILLVEQRELSMWRCAANRAQKFFKFKYFVLFIMKYKRLYASGLTWAMVKKQLTRCAGIARLFISIKISGHGARVVSDRQLRGRAHSYVSLWVRSARVSVCARCAVWAVFFFGAICDVWVSARLRQWESAMDWEWLRMRERLRCTGGIVCVCARRAEADRLLGTFSTLIYTRRVHARWPDIKSARKQMSGTRGFYFW